MQDMSRLLQESDPQKILLEISANPATILTLVKVCRAAKECSLGCMADKLREALKEISE